MYRIIGADQKEYGPVSAEQLRQWLAENRVLPHTLIQPEGATEWLPLASLPEFAPAFPASPLSRPIAPPGPAAPAKSSGLAITSLVLSLLALLTCGLTALPGLILGLLAHRKIKKSEGRLAGAGLAVAGITVSAIFLVLLPLVAVLLLPAVAGFKAQAQALKCVANLAQLSTAMQTYLDEHQGQFPPAATWCDALQSRVFSPKAFQCAPEPAQRCAYAFNARLGGMQAGDVNPRTVLLFESGAGWNGNGGAEKLAPHQHSQKSVYIVFADRSVQEVKLSRLGTLRWEP